MYGPLWKNRYWPAKLWFIVGGVALAWCLVSAVLEKPYPFSQDFIELPAVFQGWANQEAWAATTLVILLGAAPLMHLSDHWLSLSGFKNRHYESLAWLPLDDGSVSGLLSVQSIRTAVTTFILTALVALIPRKDGLPLWDSIGAFNMVLGFAAGLALVASLVTTLIATLCLDYSIRFSWMPAEAKLKKRSPALAAAAITTELGNRIRTADHTKLSLRDKARKSLKNQ